MNGRLYDAKLGRFLSPDNFVQDPFNTQNFNRYGYVVNNPLSYTDESGEFIHIIIGAVIGGLINLTVKAIQGDIHSFGDGLMAFGIGAVAGAVGSATGGAAFLAAGGGAAGAGGFMAGFAGGAVGSALSSPIQSLGNHLYFGDPLMSFKDWAIGIGIGGGIGGVINGGVAAFRGKSFLTGNARVNPITPQTSGVAPINNNPTPSSDNLSSTSVSSIENTTPTNKVSILESKYTATSNPDGGFPSINREPFTPNDVIKAVKGDNYNLLGNKDTHSDLIMSRKDFSNLYEDFNKYAMKHLFDETTNSYKTIYDFGTLGTGSLRVNGPGMYRFYWYSNNTNYKFQIFIH